MFDVVRGIAMLGGVAEAVRLLEFWPVLQWEAADGGPGPAKPEVDMESNAEEEIATFEYSKDVREISDFVAPPRQGVVGMVVEAPKKSFRLIQTGVASETLYATRPMSEHADVFRMSPHTSNHECRLTAGSSDKRLLFYSESYLGSTFSYSVEVEYVGLVEREIVDYGENKLKSDHVRPRLLAKDQFVARYDESPDYGNNVQEEGIVIPHTKDADVQLYTRFDITPKAFMQPIYNRWVKAQWEGNLVEDLQTDFGVTKEYRVELNEKIEGEGYPADVYVDFLEIKIKPKEAVGSQTVDQRSELMFVFSGKTPPFQPAAVKEGDLQPEEQLAYAGEVLGVPLQERIEIVSLGSSVEPRQRIALASDLEIKWESRAHTIPQYFMLRREFDSVAVIEPENLNYRAERDGLEYRVTDPLLQKLATFRITEQSSWEPEISKYEEFRVMVPEISCKRYSIDVQPLKELPFENQAVKSEYRWRPDATLQAEMLDAPRMMIEVRYQRKAHFDIPILASSELVNESYNRFIVERQPKAGPTLETVVAAVYDRMAPRVCVHMIANTVRVGVNREDAVAPDYDRMAPRVKVDMIASTVRVRVNREDAVQISNNVGGQVYGGSRLEDQVSKVQEKAERNGGVEYTHKVEVEAKNEVVDESRPAARLEGTIEYESSAAGSTSSTLQVAAGITLGVASLLGSLLSVAAGYEEDSGKDLEYDWKKGEVSSDKKYSEAKQCASVSAKDSEVEISDLASTTQIDGEVSKDMCFRGSSEQDVSGEFSGMQIEEEGGQHADSEGTKKFCFREIKEGREGYVLIDGEAHTSYVTLSVSKDYRKGISCAGASIIGVRGKDGGDLTSQYVASNNSIIAALYAQSMDEIENGGKGLNLDVRYERALEKYETLTEGKLMINGVFGLDDFESKYVIRMVKKDAEGKVVEGFFPRDEATGEYLSIEQELPNFYDDHDIELVRLESNDVRERDDDVVSLLEAVNSEKMNEGKAPVLSQALDEEGNSVGRVYFVGDEFEITDEDMAFTGRYAVESERAVDKDEVPYSIELKSEGLLATLDRKMKRQGMAGMYKTMPTQKNRTTLKENEVYMKTVNGLNEQLAKLHSHVPAERWSPLIVEVNATGALLEPGYNPVTGLQFTPEVGRKYRIVVGDGSDISQVRAIIDDVQKPVVESMSSQVSPAA